MSLMGRVARGAVWAALGRWGQLALSLVTAAVMARIVGPDGYGIIALAFVILNFGDIFVGGSLTESVVQHDAPSRGQLNATFWLVLGLGGLLWGLIILCRESLAAFLGSASLTQVLPAMGILLPLTAAGSVPLAILQRDLRQKDIAQADMVSAAAGSAAGLTLVFSGAGLWSIALMEIIRVALRVLLYARRARWMPGFSGDFRQIRELLAFNGSVLGARILAYIDRVGPRGLVGIVLGEQAIGFYALAYRLLDQLNGALVGPLGGIGLAAAARSRSDVRQLRRLLVIAIRLSSLMAYPAFLGLAAIAPLAVPVIFGAAWTGAVPVIQIVLLIALRSSVTTFNAALLRGVGRPHWQLVILGAGTLLTVIFVPFAIQHGLEAVALVMLLRNLATWPLAATLVKRAIGLPVRIQMTAGGTSLLAALAMAVAVYGVIHMARGSLPDLSLLGLAVALGVTSYAGLMVVLERGEAVRLFKALRGAARGDRQSFAGLSGPDAS